MKYKIFGLSLVGFIIFLCFLWLRPETGIDSRLLKSSNIDSIETYNLANEFTIYKRTDIDQIAYLLQNAPRIKKGNPKAFIGFYDLYFYVNGKKNPIDLRISQHRTDALF
jgi:hypothetical protein